MSDDRRHDPRDGGSVEHENLVGTMFRAAHGMRRFLALTVPEIPGGMPAWGVMRVLHHSGPLTQAELARRLGVAASTLTRRLEQMESDGLVTRAPDPDDGRRIIVSLTDAAVALRDRHHEQRAGEAARLTIGASTADLAAFGRVLTVIGANLRELGIEHEPHGARGGRGAGATGGDGGVA